MTVRPLALLVPIALSATLLVGCGGDDGDPEAGPSETTSETSTEPTTEATDEPSATETTEPVPEPSGSTTVDPDDDPEDPFGDDDTDAPVQPVPADAADLCGAFEDAYNAFLDVGDDYPSEAGDPVPPALVEAFRQWGRDLADAELPDDFTDEQREGVDVMSRLLLAIPDRATGRDLDALDSALSRSDEGKVEAVTDYVEDTCDLDF